jgi:hypothetical protein
MASSASNPPAGVRVFTPKNHLANVVGGSGKTALELADAANAGVASMSVALVARLQRQVARLAAIRVQGEAALLSSCDELSLVAMDIAELAGAAGRPFLGDAARGILAMMDAKAGDGLWRPQALEVHIDALALLNAQPAPATADVRKVLAQLFDMRRFIGVSEPGSVS